MTDPIDKWERRFMRLALEARTWVKGPDLGVGACVVSPDRRGLSLGFSGLPRGLDDTDQRITLPDFKDYHMVHAELNAILNASQSVVGWTMYVDQLPLLALLRVHDPGWHRQGRRARPGTESRWHRSHLEGHEALREAGLTVTTIDMEDLA